jgi:hypothetical protein
MLQFACMWQRSASCGVRERAKLPPFCSIVLGHLYCALQPVQQKLKEWLATKRRIGSTGQYARSLWKMLAINGWKRRLPGKNRP